MDRYERLGDILRRIEDVSPSQRTAFLRKECGSDSDLREELETLLDTFLDVDLDSVFSDFKGVLAGAREDPPSVLERLKERRVEPGDDTSESERKELERYRIRNRIAEGGMGEILKVWDKDLRRHIAMKTVRDKDLERVSTDPQKRSRVHPARRFVEEAQITGQLDHPGVVPVHELGVEANGRPFFTMRLVRGRSLREVFELVREKREGWNRTRALGTILRVCETVAFAHSRGVIHRDLKPSNIMVGKFGETYVMDWGLAKVLDSSDLSPSADSAEASGIRTERATDSDHSPNYTMEGDIVGTPAYMPPEQAHGHVFDLGPQADVYAVGAVLYQLLAGHPPYLPRGSSTTNQEILRRVREAPPPPLAKIDPLLPPELVAICDKAMSRNPDDRYDDMIRMAEDLRAFLENRVVRAYRHGPIIELRKWVARNKSVAAAAIVALTSTLGGLIWNGITEAQARSRIEASSDNLRSANDRIKEQTEILRYKNQDLEETKDQLESAISNLETSNQNLRTSEEKLRDSNSEYARILPLADKHIARDLEEEARDRLWPTRESTIPRMDAWLVRARELLGRLERHQNELANLEGLGDTDSSPARVKELRDLIQTLGGWKGDRGWLAKVEVRRSRAELMRQITVDDKEEVWEEAIDAIAANELYGGLELDPQVGLIPLGEDPNSGLWEFWLFESGNRPNRPPSGLGWQITPGTGIVLVLVPGGTFHIGASLTPGGPNYDPQSNPSEEGPPKKVWLDAFFLSKYETTQAQWSRVAPNPSFYQMHDASSYTHPVEQVSWIDVDQVCIRYGLLIPTEAQWEYALRAGTTTPYGYLESNDLTRLAQVANLADLELQQRTSNNIAVEPWNDGWGPSAPIGTYAANLWGFHDMIGNVSEWCRDLYGSYEYPHRKGDGFHYVERSGIPMRVARGGGFMSDRTSARAAVRLSNAAYDRARVLGVRFSRQIESE